MSFEVILTQDAARDLEAICDYIAVNNNEKKANDVLDYFEKIFDSLSTMPERGIVVKELLDLGMREYREVFFKPYRLIYNVSKKSVYIYLIVDGRRDMRTVLQQKFLRV